MQANFEHLGRYPQLFTLLPHYLLHELNRLKTFFAPYTDRVYMVGGSVRDLLRQVIFGQNIPIVDIDLEVFGLEPEKFEELMAKLGAKGVGKSFFVYKFGQYIDIALPRIEKKVGRGHRAFEVTLAKEEREASIRRDFCMNALMLNIFDATLLDFWGGVEDIKSRRIRIIDEEKFKEDSLRVLRGMQFSARFGFKIEPKSCEVMKSIALSDLSKERIFWEFEKMFRAKYLHFGLYAMATLDIDRKIFGFDIKKEDFFRTALELLRGQKGFETHLYKFYFLYILAKILHKPYEPFLEALQTPNEYKKVFKKQKYIPKRRTERFLMGLATNYPISQWLGNYKEDVKIAAKRLGVWEEKFMPISPKKLMQEGFSGKALGEELRRRTLKIIKERFSREELQSLNRLQGSKGSGLPNI